VTDGAINAIAMHGDPAADASLQRLVAPTQPESVRKKSRSAGNARGRPGYEALRRILRDDPSIEVRKGAIFGMSQSKVPESVDALIAIARTDPEPRVRSESLFWLAQKAGEKVSAMIADRIDQGSRYGRQEEGRVRAEPAAQGRRRAAAHQGGTHECESGSSQQAMFLARAVEGLAGDGLLRRGTPQIIRFCWVCRTLNEPCRTL